MLSQVSALALVAGALLVWPRPEAVTRLARLGRMARPVGGLDEVAAGSGLPDWVRSRWTRGLLVLGAVAGLAQVWSWSVGAVFGAAGAAAVTALRRGHRERAVVREELAAVEGLGVLVAELRAGRPADEALAAAGRHCDHPAVGTVLSRLGRSLRLGDRLDGLASAAERAPPRGHAKPDGQRGGGSDWQAELLAGVSLSRSTGCALADVVSAIQADLESRSRQRAELRANASGHRATVALLAGLPILGLAMGSGIGAEPVRILTETTTGNVVLVAGVALELLGLAWSRRLISRALRQG